jgi:hypothetical protein
MPEQRPDWAMTSPASQPETQAIIPALTDLKVGTWLEFQDHDGRTSQLKLAWISPHRNLYLLTNRQGERVLSLKAENFSKRLQDGMARLAQPAQVSSGSPGIASLNSSQKTA